MWKKFDIRSAETNEYFGTVETDTALEAAKIHFSVRGIEGEIVPTNDSDPLEVTIANEKYKIVESD